MPKPVRQPQPEFVSVARVRALTGCYPGTLLTLVARGLVETRIDHFAGFPLYRLADVRKYLPPKRGRPPMRPTPAAKGGRLVKGRVSTN